MKRTHVCLRGKIRYYANLDQLHDFQLRLRIGLDVSLRGPKIGVTSEHLNISQRTTDRRDFPRAIGDERPSPAMTGAPVEADISVPAPEQVHDGLRRDPIRSFGLDQKSVAGNDSCLGILRERGLQFLTHWYDATRPPLACHVLKVDGLPDLASSIRNHPPG